MQPDWIFSKTARGSAELEEHSLGLTFMCRRLLIMIDGKRTLGDLIHDLGGSMDVLSMLEKLSANDLIAPPAGVVLRRPEGPHAIDPGPKARLCELADSLLGGAASNITAKITACGDGAEALTTCVDGCVRLIRLTIDESKAAEFKRQANTILGHY
jgi:hypothetical protein